MDKRTVKMQNFKQLLMIFAKFPFERSKTKQEIWGPRTDVDSVLRVSIGPKL